jgi:hypothetical protein
MHSVDKIYFTLKHIILAGRLESVSNNGGNFENSGNSSRSLFTCADDGNDAK